MTAKRLYQDIARKIAELIDAGAYPAGSRLPGERDLAEKFGVSRVTIREAEIALQAIGRLEIKTGSGVYVSESKPQLVDAMPSASAFEVTEARLLVEAEAAALAARNITDADIARLEELIEAMGDSDADAANAADEKFHETIAQASNNSAIVHTVKQLWQMRETIPQVKQTYEAVCVHDAKQRIEEHREVFDALRARDAGAARAAMRGHFQRLLEAMLETTEKQALAEVQQRASESRERFLAAAKLN
ncbi:FadR/GntR family transcriptional regulator [Aurantiacibacter aquimixticola]|uniref:FadR family transcriptional regulator n=1 Tax=Aurantiacibacter aquimixticola TaxID=1958945 RepID=A0A419RW35_9SPHN|nr:FCD domain-containing protein [Aurantiacibacter aquimixticola]RJY10005.1 FadR family transcriptional regulator [Aurantiacibacter aquimixticola]